MEWKTKRFGDVCTFVRGPFGGSLKKSIFKEEGFAVYEQQHAIYDRFDNIRYFVDQAKFSEMSRFELFPGDLIMSCSGTMGKIAIVPHGILKGLINQALLKLTPKKELLPQFLKLWMESQNFQEEIESLSQGAAIKNMASVKILKEIKVPTPTLEEQKHIIAILDQAFADIEKARSSAEINLNNARELFDSYLQQVFSQRGEGWPNYSLSKICTIKPPKTEARKVLREDDLVSFVPMSCLGIDRINLDLIESRQLKDVSGSYTYFANDDVLLAKITPCFENGKLGLASNLINGVGFGSSEFIVFRCHEGLDPKFLYYYLSRKSFLEEGKMRMTGAVGHRRVAKEFIENYPIWFPSTEQQAIYIKNIDLLLRDVTNLVEIYAKKIIVMEELKKSILQKAFTGELTKSKGIAT